MKELMADVTLSSMYVDAQMSVFNRVKIMDLIMHTITVQNMLRETRQERGALTLELSHLRPEWQAVCAERDALRALVGRYGADQWRRGNAGKEPQELDEWQKEVQP